MISYILKLVGTSLLLTLIVIHVSEEADAAPVRVAFSGAVNPLRAWPEIPPFAPGTAAYEEEILAEIPPGTA